MQSNTGIQLIGYTTLNKYTLFTSPIHYNALNKEREFILKIAFKSSTQSRYFVYLIDVKVGTSALTFSNKRYEGAHTMFM